MINGRKPLLLISRENVVRPGWGVCVSVCVSEMVCLARRRLLKQFSVHKIRKENIAYAISSVKINRAELC